MIILKNIIKNKTSSLIIVICMAISMIGFNIVFNMFFNSSVESFESNVISKNNIILSAIFGKEHTLKEVNDLIKEIDKLGVKVAYSREITFKGEMFDKQANVICVSNTKMYDFNLLKGRDINNQDINKGEKIAVISYVYEDLCRKKGDKLFIDIDNDSYEVVGVLGNKYSSSYYKLQIFIPYTAAPQNWIDTNKVASQQFLLSSDNININVLKDKFDIKQASFSTPPVQKINYFLFSTKNDVIYFLTLSLIAIVNIVIFSIYWVCKKQNQIGILKAIGYSTKATNALVRNELLVLGFISAIISSLIYYPFSKFFNKNFFDMGLNGSPIIFIADIMFSFICCFIVIKFNNRRLNKLSISSNINIHINLSKNLLIKIIMIVQIFLVLNYSVEAFNSLDFVFGIMNRAKSIIQIKNVKVVDPFSVSYDDKVLDGYNVRKTLSDLKKEKDIGLVTYLYDVDTSSDVEGLNNKDKINNYVPTYYYGTMSKIQGNGAIPLVYIEQDSFKQLKIKVKQDILKNEDTGTIPVFAGYDYKTLFSEGDIIKGKSGNRYKIVAFLDKNQYMFATNSGSDALSYTNNLNSFLVVPFDIKDTRVLPPTYREDDLDFYSMTNSFIIYKGDSGEKYIDATLKHMGIRTTYLSDQMKKFTLLNFNYVAYKLFNAVMILLISLSGVIGFILSAIFSEKRYIGIKIALGFSKKRIILEYIINTAKLLCLCLVLLVVRYNIHSEINLTIALFLKTFCVAIFILIPVIILTRYFINNFEVRELIGGNQ
ncbi:ABC transporter permease [Clostridium sp. C8-1-8]|uniref:ABC transporter permease n=1 Tax=Clostridium sp. C8-1-8 TaxID=2698831 RepID=UPI00136C73E8|nr:ABC transporter permease [Clostridium sp. C8-1-8]